LAKAGWNCLPGGGTDMELLIRTVHKHPVVATIHESASQMGDVIAACPDGWAWSESERSHPDWIIVRASITDIEVEALLEPARPGEGSLRRRLGVSVVGLVAGDVLNRSELMGRVY